jgi:hypothetical protein
MTGYNLPPGCTDRDIDNAFGSSDERRGVYRVRVTNRIESQLWVEVEASSREDAEHDALVEARKTPIHRWTVDADDMDVEDVEGPPERDPDDERDSRADYEYDRNR